MSTFLLENKYLLQESGLRNIRELAQRYENAKIYFHMDTDGVTTAIAMKHYLESYGIKVVEAELIQYGDKEFAIKKPMARGDIMPVLVDFAHGKPMFIVHTDHHDKQIGVEKGTAKQFRGARSNVETISQIVSPKELFPHKDILMISTIDSANFASMGITPEQVMNYVFALDKEKSLEDNKKAMALVTNKLLLAYKNKPKFLETLVMECSPSLLNIYQHIVKLAKQEGYVSPEVMAQNAKIYRESMKTSGNVKYDPITGIISQYGGGPLSKPGAYDRYVPFKNYPDANFIIIVWPMGILQASCNPFKVDRALKGVNLGEIAQKVLSKFETELRNNYVTLERIKYATEREAGEGAVGFTYHDLIAIYGETEGGIKSDRNGQVFDWQTEVPPGSKPDYTVDRWHNSLKNLLSRPYIELDKSPNRNQIMSVLKMLKVSWWDLIQANSGGHKCITNLSGFQILDGKVRVELLKALQIEFEKELKVIVFEELKANTPEIGGQPKNV